MYQICCYVRSHKLYINILWNTGSVSPHSQIQLPNYLDVHGSVHHNIHLIEITNKMRPCSRIYYSIVS